MFSLQHRQKATTRVDILEDTEGRTVAVGNPVRRVFCRRPRVARHVDVQFAQVEAIREKGESRKGAMRMPESLGDGTKLQVSERLCKHQGAGRGSSNDAVREGFMCSIAPARSVTSKAIGLGEYFIQPSSLCRPSYLNYPLVLRDISPVTSHTGHRLHRLVP